ncbi:hypothetical protein P3342_011835 [Pyrenophora teres f. teres]|nr:hypothetical protein P3342_011835 [Pyrenophora teres f. teres]
MEEIEEDLEEDQEEDLAEDSEEAKQATEAVSALTAMTADAGEKKTYEDEDDDGTASYVEQQFFTEQCLADQAFLHHISGDDIYCRRTLSTPASQFLIEDRYARSVYQGILPDTGAANVSTVGREQYLALTREDPTVTMNISTAGKASIKFGKGSVTASIGTVQVSTEIGNIDFEVLKRLHRSCCALRIWIG